MIASSLPFFASEFSRAASSGLIAAIWQGALLAAVVAIALRFVPKIPAAARFAIWLSVFALIALLPFVPAAPSTAALAQASPSVASPLLTLDARWTLAIIALWAIASITRAVTLILAAHRVRRLWKNATPLQSTEPVAIGRRRALVCSSTEVDRPAVIGFFSPRILIPAWLLEKLTQAELEQVVLHEAGHLGRSDDWLNLLQKLALVFFPLNPALAWVERRLCFERELACDERVLVLLVERAHSSARTGYASCLATLAGYRLERRGLVRNLALALGALGTSARESELGQRVRRILQPTATMRPLHTRLVMGGAMLSLLFATTRLERCPQVVGFSAPAVATDAIASASPVLLPGYHPVATRVNIPQPMQASRGDATPQLSHRAVRHAAMTEPLQLQVGDTAVHAAASPQSLPPAEDSQDAMVVTRWSVTEWQSGNEVHVVQTRATMTRAALPTHSRNVIEMRSDALRNVAASPAARQVAPSAEEIATPYAAVPVPGGWLVFQL